MSGSGYGAASWSALGTYVQLVVDDADALAAARTAATRVLAEVDRACSRFRDDSDLVRANRAAGRPVRVPAVLLEAVAVAVAAAQQTDGIVDPTLGAALAHLGYDRDFATLTGDPTAVPRPPAVHPVRRGAWREIELDPPEGLLRVPHGVELDLGATGKAFAAQRVAAAVGALGVHAVVSLGGDVALTPAHPTRPVPPWPVQVSERPDDAPAEQVVLTGGGLATSSSLQRRWRTGDRQVHHLLDPTTGRPAASLWRTVTVWAGSCIAANTASTAAVVLGERALPWLTARGRDEPLGARLVGHDANVVVVGSWPPPTSPGVHTGSRREEDA